ncbi:hypothetical protein GGE07_005668 [Sinorhizobium terangae]|uniref:Ulp1 family isopeptidase n=1 Tax=Sinorhizobium terangae TaxID=110322 RepID=UPI0017C3B427|nr:Ulp1 family isopeptidase [Sinorhizobium terangae]MBB4188989.1 hypothetical protein [Sinorhizobium terangae]
MEPNYNGWLDTEGWMRDYAALQERQRAAQRADSMPADQACFEQNLAELHLSSSDESSAETASPDTRSAEPHRSVQWTDDGGLMQVPLQDNRFSSTRHSVDLPRAHLDSSAAGLSQSDLRDRLFSSTRYTAQPESLSAARPKDSKRRGLWSRFKSEIGKTFGGKKSSGGSGLHVVHSELRMDFSKRSRPCEEDVRLLSDFRRWALDNNVGNYARGTIHGWSSALSMFGDWLQQHPRYLTLNSLLEDPIQLQARAKEFLRDHPGVNLHLSLEKLQNFHAGEVGPRREVDGSRRRHQGHPADEELINQFVKIAGQHKANPLTIDRVQHTLRRFAEWLPRNEKPSIASRYKDPSLAESLAEDVLEYKQSGGDRQDSLKSALANLLRLAPGEQHFEALGAGGRVMGRRTLNPYPDDGQLIDLVAQERFRSLGSRPTEKQKSAIFRLASTQRRFSDWLQRENKGSIVSRLKGDHSSELKSDVAAFYQAINRTAPNSLGFKYLRQYLQVLEANRALGVVPPEQAGWEPGPVESQVESYDQLQAWHGTGQAGWQGPPKWTSTWSSQQVDQANWQGSVGSGSTWMPQVPSDFDPNMWPTPESTSARSSDIYRGLDSLVDLPSTSTRSSDIYGGLDSLVDLPPTPQGPSYDAYQPAVYSRASSNAQTEVSKPTASSHGRSGRVLGAQSWLDDEHIAADYTLLAQELQRHNPDLAARTRLVDPLVAHYHLRLGSGSVAARAFQRIVQNHNGNDTADFLFLPVSDASAADPERRGSHWSLLLLDRRDRARPVAYHYDSARGYNSEPAAMLARQLGARLNPARMAQQQNEYDCGVFVLDGTRALVRRLAQNAQPPVLHLDDLVANRRALQNRLRAHPDLV